jgi:hypothetical protein
MRPRRERFIHRPLAPSPAPGDPGPRHPGHSGAMTYFTSFWSWIAVFFWISAYVAYLCAVVYILMDIIRDHTLNGWGKAIWVLFLVFVPFLTGLVYVIARGRGMAARWAPRHDRAPEYSEEYVRSVSFADPDAEIAKAQALRAQGSISDGEFDAIRNKALGNRY